LIFSYCPSCLNLPHAAFLNWFPLPSPPLPQVDRPLPLLTSNRPFGDRPQSSCHCHSLPSQSTPRRDPLVGLRLFPSICPDRDCSGLWISGVSSHFSDGTLAAWPKLVNLFLGGKPHASLLDQDRPLSSFPHGCFPLHSRLACAQLRTFLSLISRPGPLGIGPFSPSLPFLFFSDLPPPFPFSPLHASRFPRF